MRVCARDVPGDVRPLVESPPGTLAPPSPCPPPPPPRALRRRVLIFGPPGEDPCSHLSTCQVDTTESSAPAKAAAAVAVAAAAPAGKQGAAKGSSPQPLDASAASAAATPPPGSTSRSKAPPGDAQTKDPAPQVDKKGKRKPGSGSAQGAPPSLRRGSAAGASGRRPARASKSRAQEQLKERDYSSDSLMEESELEEDVAAEQTASRAGGSSGAPSSTRRQKALRVRFSIEGESRESDATGRRELEDAVGGDMSPIAMEDDEVICVGDELDTEKQDARREAQRRAALEAVDEQLGALRYGSPAGSCQQPAALTASSTQDALQPPSELSAGGASSVVSGAKRRRTGCAGKVCIAYLLPCCWSCIRGLDAASDACRLG